MFLKCLICFLFLLIFVIIIYNLLLKQKLSKIKGDKKTKNKDWYPGTPIYENYKS